MELTFDQLANGSVLWIITIIAIGLVLFQVLIFLKKSITAGKEMGIPKETMKLAFKTGSISAIGPAVVIVVGMVSLLITVGAPTALMRLGYIGNVAYELLAVEFAADAFGVEVSAGALPPEVFCTALWCMALGCVGWIVFATLFTHKIDTVSKKLVGKNAKLLPVISSAAMLGAYGYLNAGYVIGLDANTVAILSGFFIMLFVIIAYRKTKKRFLNEWGLSIAMFGGMILASVLK